MLIHFHYQVELRVLPDDQGIRRIRVYGSDHETVNVAKEELQFVYQEIFIEKVSRIDSIIIIPMTYLISVDIYHASNRKDRGVAGCRSSFRSLLCLVS